MKSTRLGIAIVSLGLLSAGCNGHFTGPRWKQSPDENQAARTQNEPHDALSSSTSKSSQAFVPVVRKQTKFAIHPGDVPEDVQGNFARDFPGSDIKKVVKKIDDNGNVEYWYCFDDLAYHEHFATYDPSGKLLWDKPAGAVKDYFKYDQRPPQILRYSEGSLD